MATVRNERLHKDEPLLIPGLSAFHHAGASSVDKGTFHESDRRKRSYRPDGVKEMRAEVKRARQQRKRANRAARKAAVSTA